MRLLSGTGTILSLFPFFLGWLSLVAASSDVVDDANGLHQGKRCVKPQVRREWRALSDGERAEWISAVKVKPFLREIPSLELIIPVREVLGKSPTQGICCPLPEPCKLHCGRSIA